MPLLQARALPDFCKNAQQRKGPPRETMQLSPAPYKTGVYIGLDPWIHVPQRILPTYTSLVPAYTREGGSEQR